MKVAVLIPKVFNYPFTYNSELETPLKPGEFVVVPFGKQEEIGVIWDKIEPTQKKIKIRNIKHKIENYSIDKKDN